MKPQKVRRVPSGKKPRAANLVHLGPFWALVSDRRFYNRTNETPQRRTVRSRTEEVYAIHLDMDPQAHSMACAPRCVADHALPDQGLR